MARRGTKDEWRERLARWASFEGTVAAFCKDEGVSDKAFYVWRKRLSEPSPRGTVELVELERSSTSAGIELVVEGVVVRVRGAFDATALRGVLDVLAERR